MPVSDCDFCAWILQRCAIRERATDDGKVVYRGNLVGETYARPVQCENEATESFDKRLRAWKRTLAKGNTKVLAFAHEYLVTEKGYDNYSAAYELVEHYAPQIPKISQNLCDELRALGVQPHWWANNKPVVGGSLRALRQGRKVAGYTQKDRQAESLRTGVARYKKQHANFRDEYRMWYGAFRYEQKRPANVLTLEPALGTYIPTAKRFSPKDFPTVPLDPKKPNT
jgi:hypothetical protein